MAGVLVGAGVPLIAYDTVNGATVLNGQRFTLLSGIFSSLAVVCYLLCYHLTTERVRAVESPKSQQGVAELLRRALKHRALISIIVASVVMLLAQLTMQSMANYVYPNYYGNVAAQSISTFAMMGGMFLAAGVAKPLSSKFGKAEISVAASALAPAVCILLFIIQPQSMWVYVALNCISWLGLGVFSMVSWALITDVIDDAEIRNGKREDGSIYALYSFARKVGQALAAGLSGGLLSLIGYSDKTAFDPAVLDGIYAISTLLPAVGFALLAVVLWFWYPLHKHTVEENVEVLRRKHEA